MQISAAVLAVSLVLILKQKKMGKLCQLFSVFSPPFISGLILLLASLRFIRPIIDKGGLYFGFYF